MQEYVESGGILVIGARTATRNIHNNIVSDTTPGVLRKLAGVSVIEYGKRSRPDIRPLALNLNDGGRVDNVDTWYELLEPADGTTVTGTWEGRHLTGQPAISRRRVGKGSVFYVGTYLTEKHFGALLPQLIGAGGLEPLWPGAPAGVSVTVRENRDKQLWFFINTNSEEVNMPSTPQGVNLITGKQAGTALKLAPNGVAVIRA